MNERLFAAIQHITPQKLLSRTIGYLAASKNPVIKNTFIQWFKARYKVDLSEALIQDVAAFENFNAFFTRALKPGAREIAPAINAIACPADGAVSEIGEIKLGSLIQAKGQAYSLISLLGNDGPLSASLLGGKFATIYLSPKDYHRVHMPIDGTLVKTTYVPGKLFSVNQATANQIPNLFARNERLVCEFESVQGPFVVILVGAMIVAGIETTWAGHVAPVRPQLQTINYRNPKPVKLKKGDEIGRFKLGSTAIIIFPEKTVAWDEAFENGTPVKMGQSLGTIS